MPRVSAAEGPNRPHQAMWEGVGGAIDGLKGEAACVEGGGGG